jgi:hypothetical protein
MKEPRADVRDGQRADDVPSCPDRVASVGEARESAGSMRECARTNPLVEQRRPEEGNAGCGPEPCVTRTQLLSSNG